MIWPNELGCVWSEVGAGSGTFAEKIIRQINRRHNGDGDLCEGLCTFQSIPFLFVFNQFSR